MPSTRYLYATAPDGSTVKRRTHRDYSHAVLVFDDRPGHREWGAWSWNGRLDLAVRERDKAARHYRSVAVVPVTETKP